jgi:2-oxo-4-hydroxy-4-carboxy--5-ureidoimidazoline (OHCU) decarboxylase
MMAEERLTAIAQILRIVRFRLESRVTQEGATRQ